MTEAEKQYIDLYAEASEAIKEHSAEVMNAVRDRAFEYFRRQGFPTRKVERYKYTDMEKIFAPNYGLNINRIEFPVDPFGLPLRRTQPEHAALFRRQRCVL